MAGNYGLLNMYMPTFRTGTTALSAPALSLPDLSFGGTGIPSATIPLLESLDVTAELSKAMTLSPLKTGLFIRTKAMTGFIRYISGANNGKRYGIFRLGPVF